MIRSKSKLIGSVIFCSGRTKLHRQKMNMACLQQRLQHLERLTFHARWALRYFRTKVMSLRWDRTKFPAALVVPIGPTAMRTLMIETIDESTMPTIGESLRFSTKFSSSPAFRTFRNCCKEPKSKSLNLWMPWSTAALFTPKCLPYATRHVLAEASKIPYFSRQLFLAICVQNISLLLAYAG